MVSDMWVFTSSFFRRSNAIFTLRTNRVNNSNERLLNAKFHLVLIAETTQFDRRRLYCAAVALVKDMVRIMAVSMSWHWIGIHVSIFAQCATLSD
eukprot:SAG31_NODE_3033_length_4764_cov_1.641372_3_plen_95_part_00